MADWQTTSMLNVIASSRERFHTARYLFLTVASVQISVALNRFIFRLLRIANFKDQSRECKRERVPSPGRLTLDLSLFLTKVPLVGTVIYDRCILQLAQVSMSLHAKHVVLCQGDSNHVEPT
jgi:hypothetical protein